MLALAIGVIQGAAQVTTVRGIVTTEEDGEPVIGASVIVKATALGTVTDVNGRFELSGLSPSATRLLISYISLMAKEVAIAPQVSVTLKSEIGRGSSNGFGYFTREKGIGLYGTGSKTGCFGARER